MTRDLVLMGLVAISALASDLPIGHVVVFEGVWIDQSRNNQRISQMDVVFRSSRIVRSPDRPASGNETMTLRIGGSKVPYRCSEQRTCSGPLVLPSPSQNPILDQAYSVLAGGSGYYAHTLSRTSGQLAESVSKLTAPTMLLKTLLRNLASGVYHLEFCPVDETGRVLCSDGTPLAVCYWSPSLEVPCDPGLVRSRLYQVNVMRLVGRRFERTANAAWTLVVNESRWTECQTRFESAVSLSSGWDSAEQSAFLKAYLQSLAQDL